MSFRTGHVKWYNQDKNYGFILDLDADTPRDVFVHCKDLVLKHENLSVTPSLYTGEYVEFQLGPAEHQHAGQRAVLVRGIRGGPLLCEMGTLYFHSYTRVNFAEEEEPEKDRGHVDKG